MILKFKKNNQNNLLSYVDKVIDLEKKCFPSSWIYVGIKQYYLKEINKNENVSIFLFDGDKMIGFLLAVSSETVLDEIIKHDKVFHSYKNSLYIETVEIDPKYQGMGLFKKILIKLVESSIKKRIDHISLHARITNDTADKTKKIFLENGLVLCEERNIKKWFFGGGEPYKYLNFKLNKK